VVVLKEEVIPGITMTGTAPTFFKITVTEALSKAMVEGQYPDIRTIVYEHVPNIPRPPRRLSEGMKDMDNRRVYVTCFEASIGVDDWERRATPQSSELLAS